MREGAGVGVVWQPSPRVSRAPVRCFSLAQVRDINRSGGFFQQLVTLYGPDRGASLWETINSVFDWCVCGCGCVCARVCMCCPVTDVWNGV
jgi:hypothetical protein